jgi:hypothetical protein
MAKRPKGPLVGAQAPCGPGWRNATSANLDVMDSLEEKEIRTIDDEPRFVSSEIILADMEAEIREIQRKLDNEQACIDEARSLRARQKKIDGAILFATKRSSDNANDTSFFLTHVAGIEIDDPKKQSLRELYPNYSHEVKLAKEASVDKHIEKIKSGSVQILSSKRVSKLAAPLIGIRAATKIPPKKP